MTGAQELLEMMTNLGQVPIKIKYYGTTPQLSQEGWGS